jgi:hypothetical protein
MPGAVLLGRFKFPYESGALIRKTDAFMVNYFERASVLYYFRGGQWLQYIVSD